MNVSQKIKPKNLHAAIGIFNHRKGFLTFSHVKNMQCRRLSGSLLLLDAYFFPSENRRMKEKQLYLGLTAVHFGFAQRALNDDDNTH